jgi:hypothetical protein
VANPELLSLFMEAIWRVRFLNLNWGGPEELAMSFFYQVSVYLRPILNKASFFKLCKVCWLGTVFGASAVQTVPCLTNVEVTACCTTSKVNQVFCFAGAGWNLQILESSLLGAGYP